MAELGRVFVLQGGTQHNMAALKAQVDYIEERVPGAEVYVHPHTGEAGAHRRGHGGAARGPAAAVRSTFVGLDQAIDISLHLDQRRERRAATSVRTTARARSSTPRPRSTARPRATSRASRARRVRSRTWTRCAKLNKPTASSRMTRYPNLVDFEAKLCVQAASSRRPSRCRRHGALVKTDVVDQARPARRRAPEADQAAVPALLGRGADQAASEDIRIGIPRVLEPVDSTGAALAHVLRDAGHPHAQRRVLGRDQRGDVAGGRQVRLDRSVLPVARCAQAHIHDLLFNHHEKKALQLHLLPLPSRTSRRTSSRTRWTRPRVRWWRARPRSCSAAFTKEIDFFSERGIEYLDAGRRPCTSS